MAQRTTGTTKLPPSADRSRTCEEDEHVSSDPGDRMERRPRLLPDELVVERLRYAGDRPHDIPRGDRRADRLEIKPVMLRRHHELYAHGAPTVQLDQRNS